MNTLHLVAMDSGPLYGWFTYQNSQRGSPYYAEIQRLRQEIIANQKKLNRVNKELDNTKDLSEIAFAMWSRWFSVSQPINYSDLCDQVRETQEIIHAHQQRLNDLLHEKK